MKLQNLTVIFVIIILPIILMTSLYISTGIKTIKYQSLYDTGLLTATHDAIYAFEINTAKNVYSDNAETKRNILKSSVKAFEKSLCNTCGISSYNTDEIEKYIPAIVFGMYDGFYMYAPSKSYNSETGKTEYSHSLKNYVYYSETLDDGTVIIYSLDNYVTVSGYFNGKYRIKEGYLIDLDDTTNPEGTKYKGIDITEENIDGKTNTDAIKYYKEAYAFTKWFLEEVEIQKKTKDGVVANYLDICDTNDPEDETSSFVQHKREVIKQKIESVLNSSITAYSARIFGQNYKMPKLSVEDWEKIYSNISMLTFFQGKSIGLAKYNGYCVLNSTNSNEYVNPNLMYFIDGEDTYHDIRCGKCEDATKLIGYKIGDFQKIKLDKLLNEDGTPKTDENGKQLYDNNGTKTTSAYRYNHSALACYECVNGSLATNTSVYNYVEPNDGTATDTIKTSYWTSLARERYRTTKLLDIPEITGEKEINIKVEWEDDNNTIGIRPNKLELVIEENGDEFNRVTVSNENEWEITLENLDIDSNYRLKEDSIPKVKGYTFEIADEENTLKITYILCRSHVWNEGVCSNCGYECSHSYFWGSCKYCGESCPHNWVIDNYSHECTICGMLQSHTYENGKCTICKHECSHSYFWGSCKYCGESCPHNWVIDNYSHECTICGMLQSHTYKNGKCKVCYHECSHSYYYGSCEYCGKSCSHDWEITNEYHRCKNNCGIWQSHNWIYIDFGPTRGYYCNVCGRWKS